MKVSVKRILVGAGVALAVLLCALAVRAWRVESRQPAVAAVEVPVDAAGAARRLAGAISYPTVSVEAGERDPEPFLRLHEYLAEVYPRVGAELARETVSGLSLLYTWPGSEPGLAPVVLLGHLDVVPVAAESGGEWTHPPFAGRVIDGRVWGRGALDDKVTVIAVLEAAEALLAEGFRPRRTLHFAFGHDEELGGREGAGRIAERLASRGVGEPALVLDEGGLLADGLVPGLPGPAAVVGIAEKGFVSLRLSTSAPGGHSSVPPPTTAVGRVARAVARLEAEPFPLRVTPATDAMLTWMTPEAPWPSRLLLANRWLFGPLVVRTLAASPEGAASLRTTTAPTIFHAGVKDNVLPSRAEAVVNFRILPGDSVESVVGRVRRVVDDPAVEIEVSRGGTEPSPVSDPGSPAFSLLARTIRETAPGGEPPVVLPFLMVGGTDARHWAGRSPHVFRYLPAKLAPGDLARFHGADERVSVESVAGAVAFYRRLMAESGAGALGAR